MKPRLVLLLAALLPLAACAEPPASSAAPAKVQKAAPAADSRPAATPAEPMAKDDPRVALSAKIPGTKPQDLRATPMPGIFELRHGADITYVSADAKYVFNGDLFQVADSGDFPNLSEGRRRELRKELVDAVPESQMVVFGPANAKHTLTVFTDVDCVWCRRLHSEIAAYNKAGIRVRYMAFPRSGPDTPSWGKAEAVWCSANRPLALTRAKQGKSMLAQSCANSPVASQYELGQELGIEGTPGLVLDDGEMIPGYLSPEQLIEHLQDPARRIEPVRSN